MTLTISLPSDCSLSGTVSFVIPAVYLAANPGGNVSVSVTAGTNLQTTIAYTRMYQAEFFFYNTDPDPSRVGALGGDRLQGTQICPAGRGVEHIGQEVCGTFKAL